MKPRTLLILLVLVLGLGAFIWFYERKLPSSEERETLGKKVFALEKGDVTAVAIDAPKGSVRLERAPSPKPAKKGKEETAEPAADWRLVKPLSARADAFAVDRLLDAVTSLAKTNTLDEVDPKAVGLDKPRATVRLTTRDGEKVLRIGAEVPPGGSTIAAVDGRKGTYVVSDAVLSEVDKAPGEWRDHQVLRGNRDAVLRITLAGGPGGPVVLARRRGGFWMERPVADRADRDLVDGLLSDLTGLTADRFLDAAAQSLAALGLNPPKGAVDVVFSDGTPPARVELGTAVTGPAAPEGQPAGELAYGKVGDTVFEVRTRLGESIRRAPNDWRALQLSVFEVHDVDSATVRDAGGAMPLTRSGTDWKRGDTLISYLPVSDLLFAVTGARAQRVLDAAEAAGLAKPLLTFELHGKELGDETLTLYPPTKDGVPARVSGRDVVLLLPADTLQQIQAKLKGVREAKAVK
ncbi:MAG TPA: DUF4340 domain-containing protein [Thermoanaerobaculia bacterium]